MSKFIRVLRNGSIFNDRAEAISSLKAKLADLQDGEICIASYGATWDVAKTILGVVRVKTVDNDEKRSYTIFDNEANSAEIAAEIAKLNAQPEGISADKKVKVKVVEADGKLTSVTVTTDDIASAAELGTKGDTSAVDTAFGRIKKEAEDRTKAITDAIAALDGTVAATAESNNQYSVLTGVTQEDGKLAGKTEVKLAAVAKTGSAADVANAAVDGIKGKTVSAQITSIAEKLNDITTTQGNALKYRTVQVSDVSALGANVKEAYQVVAYTGDWAEGKGTAVGVPVKIYKDANVKEIYLGSSKDEISSDGTITKVPKKDIVEAELSLNYAYIMADGTYGMAKIPVGSFLRESEFKNGLQVAENGEVSVKVDSTSETFLTVGKNGVKLSGVQTAINTAIEGLDATVKSTGDDNVTVNVTEVDGVVTDVTVATTGLALDNAVVKNVTVNGVNARVENNMATVTIDGTDVAVANSTEPYETTVYSAPFEGKVGTNHIATGDTVAAAFKKTENTISVLATEVIANEKVTTASVSKLAESTGVVATDGAIKYTPKEGANYIGNATSVHDATVKLDAAIKNVETNALKSVAGSQAITVSGNNTVSLKLDTVKTDNALTITTDGLYLSNVWDCGTY